MSEPERQRGNDDDLVRQSDLDDPTYVNRSGGGVEDDGPRSGSTGG
jgi:hypothetical protein